MRSTALTEFAAWLAEFRRSEVAERPMLTSVGRPIAVRRKAAMLELIRRDPAAALQWAVSRSEYAGLPEEIRLLVERPFNEQADLEVVVSCPREDGAEPGRDYWFKLGTQRWQAFVFGRRREMTSQRNIPLNGIMLGDVAALRESPGEVLSDEEKSRSPLVRGHGLERCPVTGKAASAPVLLGGRVIWFADREAIEVASRWFAAAEAMPGPETAQAVFAELVRARTAGERASSSVALASGGGSAGEMTVMASVRRAAGAWTAGPKRVLCIRLDFSDAPGAPIPQTELESRMEHASAVMSEMSYGKTRIDAAVPREVYRLPKPQSHYRNPGGEQRYSELRDDASILAASDGLVRDDYDIFIYAFPSTFDGWNGRATLGGGDLWLNGNFSASVICHELGHVYGLDHASFWNASDGTVIPREGEPPLTAPAHVEYGDIYDGMGSGPFPNGHFNPQAKRRLNWITAGQIIEVSTAGTYRIYRFDHPAPNLNGPLALKVQKDRSRTYWVGYRQGFTRNLSLSSGAYVLWQFTDSRSRLLDLTPDSRTNDYEEAEDAALVIGRTFSDPTQLVHITPVARGGAPPNEYLDVKVGIGFPGNHEPVVGAPRITRGTGRELIFSAAASDPDGDSLVYTWNFGDGTTGDGPVLRKTFRTVGQFPVQIHVTDLKGGHARAQVVVDDPLLAWRVAASPTGRINDLAYDGVRLVAVGEDEILISLDGEDRWMAQKLSGRVRGLTSVTHGAGRFVAVGESYDDSRAGWFPFVGTSFEGLVWTIEPINGTSRLTEVAYGADGFVAVGERGAIYFSTAGQGWELSPGATGTDLTGLAFGEGTFVAVGARTVIRSGDGGRTWTDVSPAMPAAAALQKIQFAHGRFIAWGGNYLLSSVDGGQTWDANAAFAAGVEIATLAFGNGIFFASGSRLDPGLGIRRNVGFASPEGDIWVEFPLASQPVPVSALFVRDEFYTAGKVLQKSGAAAAAIALSRDVVGFTVVEGPGSVEKTFHISNAGSGGFEFALAVDQTWVRVSSPSGYVGRNWAEIALSVNAAGLAPGSYHAALTVSAPDTTPVKLPLSLTVLSRGAAGQGVLRLTDAFRFEQLLVLTFPSMPGKRYAMQKRSPKPAMPWSTITGSEILATEDCASTAVRFDLQEAARWFRVIELP